MNKKHVIATMVAAFMLFSASSCSFINQVGEWTDGAKSLCNPADVTPLEYMAYREEPLPTIRTKANAFGSKFAAEAYLDDIKWQSEENFVVSPISVFLALGMAAECSNNNTRAEILSALGLSLPELQSAYPLLYRSLNIEHTDSGYLGEVTTGRLDISNSIWLDDDLTTNPTCLNTLAEQYYCYGRAVDFNGANRKANNSIRKFIKRQTNNLINKEYNFDADTLFTLINTLYLKDLWNRDGDPLQKTEPLPFTSSNGTKKNVELLTGYYRDGKPFATDSFSGFFTTTHNGYKLKFLVPNDGYSAGEIFTEENLEMFGSLTDFNAVDEEQKIRYHTRCLFPEYTASYDNDVTEVLQENFGINDLFQEEHCDFSALTKDSPAYCSGVTHSVSLTVDKRGIEGASVTVMVGATSPGPDEYTDVYLDFTVNKAFGFILTDSHGTVIFSGVINNV